VKVARTVRRGGWGNTVRLCALPLPYRRKTYGKGHPCHVITCIPWYGHPGDTGQRPHPMVRQVPEDGRGWAGLVPSPKDDRGQPELPSVWSGYREERDGSIISRHLNTSVEYITVNVGGPCGEGSSPPAKRMGVGGVIVLGARESRVHGEGRQGIDIPRVDISRQYAGEVRQNPENRGQVW
jgi:hypothetical protein